jgi:hypothetical protein
MRRGSIAATTWAPTRDPVGLFADGDDLGDARRQTMRGSAKQTAKLMAFVAVALSAFAIAPAIASADEPPILKLGGETGESLRWTESGIHNLYRLHARLSNEEQWTITVEGRKYTPPAVPGVTATYHVKAAEGESGWSNGVSITYAGEQEPPPEEEPPAEEPATEGLSWVGDPAAAILSDWANVMAEPGRVTTVPDLAMPGGFAYSVELRHGDNPGGWGERAEIAQGNPTREGFEDRLFNRGDNLWIAVPVIFGSDWPINTHSWNVFLQIKQLGSLGTPILSMGSDGYGGIALFNSDSNHASSGNITRWRGPVKLNQLTELLLHVKFSPNAERGFVELYGDLNGLGIQQLMPQTYMSTMKIYEGRVVADQARIGQYRDASQGTGTSHVFFGRYVVASTRLTAESLAFLPALP